MAEPGRTVRVSGLPADVDDERLRDKLFIHFLRARNGGGEINSVTIVKATPVCALVTFEDSGVAQRVLQLSRHILEVDGKKYKVVVTEHLESLDPDKVIVSLSATVDYSQLPGGIMALTSLHRSHPDVQINYDATEEFCTLQGAYSKIQAAVVQLLGQTGNTQSAENRTEDSGQPASSSSRSAQTAQRNQESEHHSRKSKKHREQREKVPVDRPSDEHSSHRDLTPGGHSWDNTGQTDGAALQRPATPEEDFSLIVDADMFQYLQKHCQREYQHVLSQHGVDVVDMTNQGLTTLFLQVASGVREGGRDQEHLRLAREAIGRLYQENESKTRRDHFPKSILSLRGGQQRVMDSLSVRFPKLLLNEDEQNIYIIGSTSDVSEAKQFLLLDSSEVRAKKDDVASLLRYPLHDSVTRTDEQRVPFTASSRVDSAHDRIDDGARRYRLAARFKDSGLAALGSRTSDFTLRGLSSPSRPTRLGPMLGHDVLSETAGESLSRAQNTGGDILFRSDASMQNKTSNSHLIDTQPKTLTSPLSSAQPNLPGSNQLPPARSGSTLKRASSFSGTPPQKAQVTSQKSQDDSSTVRARGRSSSFSSQTGRENREVYSAEIGVSSVMWRHIKEAYSSRVDDLTSDVQVKESSSDVSSELTVTLRGANSSKVSSCQLALRRLVDSVSADFSVHELRLSELGITNTADETLQFFCAEVRSRFKKVTMLISNSRLVLIGPKALCSQVAASLREVFSGESAPKQQGFSVPSTSNWSPSTVLQMNEDQSVNLCRHSIPQVMPESQTSKADGSQERRTNQISEVCEPVNGSISPLLKKDPVIKEKVRIVHSMEMDRQRTETFVGQSTTGNDSARHVKDVGSTITPTDKKERTVHSALKDNTQQRQTEIQDTPEESRSDLRCVCGGSGTTKTKCGVTMCSNCLDSVHVNCRVCHVTPTPPGIIGKMSCSKLHISVPGFKKDSVIKITYSIPDGIQGEDHPSPGETFQGGQFEAFLPDTEKSRKLVPRLEKAFGQGLTFTVTGRGTEARVTWDCIPHKTSLHGGKSGNGYPDSTYLTRLSEVLTLKGIEDPLAKP